MRTFFGALFSLRALSIANAIVGNVAIFFSCITLGGQIPTGDHVCSSLSLITIFLSTIVVSFLLWILIFIQFSKQGKGYRLAIAANTVFTITFLSWFVWMDNQKKDTIPLQDQSKIDIIKPA